MSRRQLLLMDANVLIDFCDADATVITLISKHIGQVHVPRPILVEEVEQIVDLDWTELAITAVEPTLEIGRRASSSCGGSGARVANFPRLFRRRSTLRENLPVQRIEIMACRFHGIHEVRGSIPLISTEVGRKF